MKIVLLSLSYKSKYSALWAILLCYLCICTYRSVFECDYMRPHAYWITIICLPDFFYCLFKAKTGAHFKHDLQRSHFPRLQHLALFLRKSDEGQGRGWERVWGRAAAAAGRDWPGAVRRRGLLHTRGSGPRWPAVTPGKPSPLRVFPPIPIPALHRQLALDVPGLRAYEGACLRRGLRRPLSAAAAPRDRSSLRGCAETIGPSAHPSLCFSRLLWCHLLHALSWDFVPLLPKVPTGLWGPHGGSAAAGAFSLWLEHMAWSRAGTQSCSWGDCCLPWAPSLVLLPGPWAGHTGFPTAVFTASHPWGVSGLQLEPGFS